MRRIMMLGLAGIIAVSLFAGEPSNGQQSQALPSASKPVSAAAAKHPALHSKRWRKAQKLKGHPVPKSLPPTVKPNQEK